MTLPRERTSEARRQGTFEGQMLATMQGIQKSLDTMAITFVGIESRLRITEEKVLTVTDGLKSTVETVTNKFKESDEVHQTLMNSIKELHDYKSKVGGVMLVLGFVMPIVITVVVALILRKVIP